MLDNGPMLRLFFFSPRDNNIISCDELGQVSALTLIVKGDRSIPFFHLASDAVARCMPDSRMTVIPVTQSKPPFRRKRVRTRWTRMFSLGPGRTVIVSHGACRNPAPVAPGASVLVPSA